jgi:hypothetical protein
MSKGDQSEDGVQYSLFDEEFGVSGDPRALSACG